MHGRVVLVGLRGGGVVGDVGERVRLWRKRIVEIDETTVFSLYQNTNLRLSFETECEFDSMPTGTFFIDCIDVTGLVQQDTNNVHVSILCRYMNRTIACLADETRLVEHSMC